MTKKGARKTLVKAEQKLLPFDQSPQEPSAVPLPETIITPPPVAALVRKRYAPSDEALAAFERLEGWLRDPNNGRPVNEAAEETLRSLAKALLEGKNAWFHHVEDRLEALLACPGTAGVRAPDEKQFREAVDDVLDCLHERLMARAR